MQIFTRAVKERDRGQGYTGSPEARAQELIDATTSAVYSQMATMMFEGHETLLAMLFAIKRLDTSDRFASDELSLLSRGVTLETTTNDLTATVGPSWMSKETWLGCMALEGAHAAFRGLCDSLLKYSDEWREYFKHPFELLSALPGSWLHELTPLQKCLLWRTCLPDRLFEICQPLIVHVLGGAVQKRGLYNIRDILMKCSCTTPVVFLLPAIEPEGNSMKDDSSWTGQWFSYPAHDVQQLAKEIGKEGRVRTLAFGGSDSNQQMAEIHQAFEDCMECGYWLILENIHLGGPWDSKMLGLLKKVITASIPSGTQSDLAAPVVEVVGGVHVDFRLWITTRVNVETNIPVLLIQNALKVACDIPHSFSSLLRHTFSCSERLFDAGHVGVVPRAGVQKPADNCQTSQMILSFLHALLVYQRIAGSYDVGCNWSLDDLTAVGDQLHTVNGSIVHCLTDRRDAADFIASIYCSRCTTEGSISMLQSLIRRIVETMTQSVVMDDDTSVVPRQPTDIVSVASLLISGSKADFHRRLDKLADPPTRTFEIPDTVEQLYISCGSRKLLQNLAAIHGLADFRMTQKSTYNIALSAIQEIRTLIQSITPPHQSMIRDQPPTMTPLVTFFQSEYEALAMQLEMVSIIVDHLAAVVCGTSAASPGAQAMLAGLLKPQCSPSPLSEISLSSGVPTLSLFQFVRQLSHRITSICKWLDASGTGGRTVEIELGSFCRPERFLNAVLRHMTRQQFRSLTACALGVEVIHQEAVANELATDDNAKIICISDLWLCNAFWDLEKSAICTLDSCHDHFHQHSDRSNGHRFRMPRVRLCLTDMVEHRATVSRRGKPKKEAALGNQSYQMYRCPIRNGENGQTIGTLDMPCADGIEMCSKHGVFLLFGD
jgi:hypothetical protein